MGDNQLRHYWEESWSAALAIWGPYTRLKSPRLCMSRQAARQEGLNGSFAMIRLNDQAIVVDMQEIRKHQLEHYALEILAHEIGHHIFAPANLTDNAKIIAHILPALPSIESSAPMVANLYTDLLINNYLKRQCNLKIDEIYQKMNQQQGATGEVWILYMRIYELLWQMPKGSLGGNTATDSSEGDAWLGARIIKVYAGEWLIGASRFAALLLPYLLNDQVANELLAKLMDTRDAGRGQVPGGLIDLAAGEREVVHPSQDNRLTGEGAAETKKSAAPLSLPENAARVSSAGQCREPFAYGELLRAAGVDLSDHDIAMRYYKERAMPLVIPFPSRKLPSVADLYPEGTSLWEIGESFEDIDWFQSLSVSSRVIPGVTTVKREWGTSSDAEPEEKPLDLDLYVDCSGSMPNPQISISYTAFAGAILCLSALRAGASVQVTLWSGAKQFTCTAGFVRNEMDILRVLTGYFGGGTAFPIHVLRDSHCIKPRANPAHIVILSDEGVTTLFDKDEQGNSGWDIARKALENARGGGTMVLNLPWGNDSPVHGHWQKDSAKLARAETELGWNIFSVNSWQDMVDFAKKFSQKVYAQIEEEH